MVVAGRRPADPAVEPAGAHRLRRRPGRPLHPHGRDADALARLRPGLLWLAWRIVARRDPAAVTVAVAIAAGWLTWFINLDRTMFIFYMAPAVPFFVLAVVLALQDVLGPPGRRHASAARWAWARCASTWRSSRPRSSSSTRC